jgi:Formin Homology 2 Domain
VQQRKQESKDTIMETVDQTMFPMRSESPPPPPLAKGDQPVANDGVAEFEESPRCVSRPFPRSLSSPITQSKQIMSSEAEIAEAAAYYRRMLQAGVRDMAVQHRMHLDGVDTNRTLVQAVFGTGVGSINDDFYASRIKDENRVGSQLLPNVSSRSLDAKPNPSWKNTASETRKLIEQYKSTGRPPRHSGSIELIDLKRAGKIMVALRAFSDMTHAELVESIDCVEQIHGINRARLLEEILPTEAERDLIRAYCGRVNDLAPCSRWLKLLVAVPNYETKVKVIQTVETFTAQADQMSKQFRLVERVSDQMMDSTKLKELLSFVLSVGIILKKGCNLGNASYFKVDSLSRLAQTKSKDGQMTVMDFMVHCVAAKRPYSLNLMEDFPECETASRVNIPFLVYAMSKLYKSLEICKAELKTMKMDEITTTHWLEAEYSLRHGIKRLERFLAYAAIRFSKLEVECDLALAACRKLSRFCGVLSGQNTTACHGVITQFAKDVELASKKYDKQLNASADRRSNDKDAEVYMIRSMDEGRPAFDQQPPQPVALMARTLTLEVIAMGPKRHESVEAGTMVDETHLHHVKSLVGLYSEWIKSKDKSYERQNNSGIVPTLKKSDGSRGSDLVQAHTGSGKESSPEQAKRAEKECLRVDREEVKVSDMQPKKTSGPMEDVNMVDRAHLNPVKSLVGLYSKKLEGNDSIIEEHIHHVSSLVDLYKELLASTPKGRRGTSLDGGER